MYQNVPEFIKSIFLSLNKLSRIKYDVTAKYSGANV